MRGEIITILEYASTGKQTFCYSPSGLLYAWNEENRTFTKLRIMCSDLPKCQDKAKELLESELAIALLIGAGSEQHRVG